MSVASVKAVPNAPIEVAKQIAPEAISAGASPGTSTSRVTCHEDAPSERAASSKERSSFSAAAITVSTTRGIEKYR